MESQYDDEHVYEHMGFQSAHVMNLVLSVKRCGKRSTSTFATESHCHSFTHGTIQQKDGVLGFMSELSSMGICTPDLQEELTGLVYPTEEFYTQFHEAEVVPQDLVRPESSGVSTYTGATSRAGEHIDQVGFYKELFGRGTGENSKSGSGR